MVVLVVVVEVFVVAVVVVKVVTRVVEVVGLDVEVFAEVTVVVVLVLVVCNDVDVKVCVVKVVTSFKVVVTCVGEVAVISVDVNDFVVAAPDFVDKVERRPTSQYSSSLHLSTLFGININISKIVLKIFSPVGQNINKS